MVVIACYDVEKTRCKKYRKTFKKYLTPVQESVFEGVLSEHGLDLMKKEIKSIIDPESDSVILYTYAFGRLRKTVIGRCDDNGLL